jgi:hypothetical protein
VSAISYGDTVGFTSGKFHVESYNIELAMTNPDYELTRRISEISGGLVFTPDNFSGFADSIRLEEYVTEKHSSLRPLNSVYILIILIVGFGIEWSIRKKLRLP